MLNVPKTFLKTLLFFSGKNHLDIQNTLRNTYTVYKKMNALNEN